MPRLINPYLRTNATFSSRLEGLVKTNAFLAVETVQTLGIVNYRSPSLSVFSEHSILYLSTRFRTKYPAEFEIDSKICRRTGCCWQAPSPVRNLVELSSSQPQKNSCRDKNKGSADDFSQERWPRPR